MSVHSPKRLHAILRFLERYSLWYLVILGVVFSSASVYSLRQNNLTSIALRNQVYQADQANGDVEAALQQLRRHIYSHMHSGLSVSGGVYPPIQLKYRYERLVAAQKAAAAASSTQVYGTAQTYCERQFPVGLVTSGRIPCIQQYVAQHQAPATATVPDALYKFDFVAPVWSPDRAGISMVLAAVCWLLLIVRWAVTRWLAAQLE